MMDDAKKISIAEFEVFLAAKKYRSVRSAARHLDLKPAHVSKILARMENKLNRPLFRRSSSGIMLSREGIELASTAEKIVEIFNTQPENLDEHSETKPQLITLGSVSFINKNVIVPAIAKYSSELKNYRFRIVDIQPDEIEQAAMRGACDLFLSLAKINWGKTWQASKIAEIDWGIYASQDHPLQNQASIHELLEYPFVSPLYWQNNEFAVGNDLFPVALGKRRQGHETSSADTAIKLISLTKQIAFLPKIIEKNSTLREIKIPDLEKISRNLYIVVNSDKVKKSFVRLFTKSLESALNSRE